MVQNIARFYRLQARIGIRDGDKALYRSTTINRVACIHVIVIGTPNVADARCVWCRGCLARSGHDCVSAALKYGKATASCLSWGGATSAYTPSSPTRASALEPKRTLYLRHMR